jgi:N-acetylglucosamine-6-sulfatase
MIVVDDLRFDEIGVGGHPYLETPHIDRLAMEGALFTQAYHVTPLCSPNRASILTGQYVSRHGILDNTSRSRASHRLDPFPKELQRAGYVTAQVEIG